ncbi:hypothetical protein CSB45_04240 [candidate division KSB3 bacterium]|uniref:Peptidase MA-like domain-containing protein n=1 Tax=candidate division KSB3 bacterium TaxID=2044937 RepID=A0A2G6E862_9BACT|nr:MAG: hypothetical protein CSB45_04240 [candidate division KSB3 bacterium]PIE30588.1 MAG: hypothetical protein CSA57_02825 [candidate division KSB3 bacterium]
MSSSVLAICFQILYSLPRFQIKYICLITFLLYAPHADAWEHVITKHFYIHYQPVDRRIAQQLSQESDAIHQHISKDIGYRSTRRTAVYLCPDVECFERQQPGSQKAPRWAVGLAYPQLNRIVMRTAVTAKEGGQIKPLEIFTHETAHIILEQALAERGGAPRWLSEGFSMLHARQWTIHRQQTIAEVTLRKRFIPLRLLTVSFPADERSARIAYAQSFSLVSFLLHHSNRQLFPEFIAALKRGMDTDTALRASFGISLKTLEHDWQASLAERYSCFEYLSNSALLWFVLSLIVISAYLMKCRQAKRIQEAWEEDEAEETDDAPK